MDAPTKQHALADENLSLEPEVDKRRSRIIGGLFLGTVAGFSLLFGFGMTVMMAKKKDPTVFTKSLVGSRELPESGGSLALRALGWGTLYSVTGVSLLSFVVWKLLGVGSARELQQKMQSKFPQVPKSEPSGRSEFQSVREFVNYLIDEDKRGKEKKS